MYKYKKQGTIGSRVKALDFLRTICKAVDGYAEYQDGWSDKKVARHIGNIPTSVVQGLRREYIGKNRAAVARSTRTPTVAELAAEPSQPLGLGARVMLLERRLERLESRLIDEVIKGITTNGADRYQ